ncbi:MAG TPA: hypothetical protein DDY78_09515 [Planctomycetales bacterium]|nr:hypothetical protein [Planctomycetales bacterium]
MSKANGRYAIIIIAGLSAGMLLAQSARADDADLLKEAEARRAIAAQQAERDVRDAREESYKTARTQPGKALERLRGLLLRVDNDPDLTDQQRGALTSLLKRDLVALQKSNDDAKNPEIPSGFHLATKDPRAEDHRELVKGATDRIASAKEVIKEIHEIRDKRAVAFADTMMQVDKSAILPNGDISFPRNWKELSLLRTKKSQLTATERAILKSLDARITVDATDQRFGGMIDFFQKQMAQTIVLDKPSLDDLNINNESTTVSLHLDKVSTRTALKKMLADLGLTYIIKDETIFVTTPAKAKENLTVRTYYVGDLVPQYDLRFGSSIGQLQALQTINQLVNMVQNNIDKDSWEANGKEGGGTIVFSPPTMSLIVKQSAEVHYKVMQGLVP